eukprot:scaffold14068_cov119-Isochrysis_galbana.AAC.19
MQPRAPAAGLARVQRAAHRLSFEPARAAKLEPADDGSHHVHPVDPRLAPGGPGAETTGESRVHHGRASMRHHQRLVTAHRPRTCGASGLARDESAACSFAEPLAGHTVVPCIEGARGAGELPARSPLCLGHGRHLEARVAPALKGSIQVVGEGAHEKCAAARRGNCPHAPPLERTQADTVEEGGAGTPHHRALCEHPPPRLDRPRLGALFRGECTHG